MNRIEFMTTLASLLQDVPVEERREAMKYYNDYFDDAGTENEEEVVNELGSPEKVAATIKEGIDGYAGYEGEFTDTGYHEPRYEKQDVPDTRDMEYKNGGTSSRYDYGSEVYGGETSEKKERWTSKPLKIILIIAIILFAIPVAVPVVLGILAVAAGLLISFVVILIALVVASVAVAIAGIGIFVTGVIHLFTEFAVGLALTGVGLILLPLGAIAVVATVKLCMIVIPGIIRGFVGLVHKPFQRKAVE